MMAGCLASCSCFRMGAPLSTLASASGPSPRMLCGVGEVGGLPYAGHVRAFKEDLAQPEQAWDSSCSARLCAQHAPGARAFSIGR